MSEKIDVKQILNSISEEVVFLDVDEKKSLGVVLNGIETLINWATAEKLTKTEIALKKVVDILESLILDESEDAEKDIEIIGHFVSELQKMVENNHSEDDLDFSDDLSRKGAQDINIDASSAIVDEDILADYIIKQKIEFEEFEEIIINYEKNNEPEQIDELKRKIHTLKGESAIIGITDVERICHEIEEWLIGQDDINTDKLFYLLDWLNNKIKKMEGREVDLEDVDEVIKNLHSEKDVKSGKPEDSENTPFKPIIPEHLPENADAEIFSDFLTKQISVMEDLEMNIIKLDSGDKDTALSTIKGLIHTLKGEANLMGLTHVGEVCHDSETFISENESVTDFLFVLKDWLTDIFDYYSGKKAQLPKDRKLNKFLKSEKEDTTQEEAEPAGNEELEPIDDPELVVDFISEAEEHLEMANTEMLGFEETEDMEKINGIFRAFHTIKGVAGFLNLDDIRLLSHKTEDLLDKIRKQKIELTDSITDVVYVAIDKLKELIALLAKSAQKGFKPPRDPSVNEVVNKIIEVSPDLDEQLKKPTFTPKAGVKAEPDLAKKMVATDRSAGGVQKNIKIKENIKVDAVRLDHLIDFIGELAIAESMLTQSQELRHVASADLLKRMNRLDKITKEVQSTSMSLRMVTVRSTFQKMARLVRDLAKKSGKKVDFSMKGEDTELDKNVVEQIGDPLVHLVRNAVDHGIEANARDRREKGKNEVGHIQLSAFHKGGNIYIEITDDGKGLDRDAILEKAIEKGIITENTKLKDNEIWNLIFEPGFSTAKKVTDVSGRGVGMDVVRKNIEAMRGYINIKSEKDKGSTFTIVLPLTLAIIDGMVIKIGIERYIIPTLSVISSIKPTGKDYFTAAGKGEMIKFQENLIPLFRLSEYFNIQTDIDDINDSIVVLVESGMKKLGIIVDHLLGQQQIVIKSLKGDMKDIKGISGGAIMPDGTVALILDIGGLVDISTQKVNSSEEKNELDH
ncbi:MAG: Hpt domain-containing protein [Fidelibacterota bacterium]